MGGLVGHVNGNAALHAWGLNWGPLDYRQIQKTHAHTHRGHKKSSYLVNKKQMRTQRAYNI